MKGMLGNDLIALKEYQTKVAPYSNGSITPI